MKQTFFYFIFLLLVMASIGGCAKRTGLNSPEDPLPPDNDEVTTIPRHGVCRMNLQRESNAKVVEIANNIVRSEIPLVRINGVKVGGSIDQVIHSINTFSQKGVKVLLMQPPCDEMFPEGYEQIPGPSHPVYRMSDIDLDRFSNFMDELLEQIALRIPEDALIGFELFNEANQAGYNGDLQPTSDGKGEIFTVDTPLDKPSFQDAYLGINKYGKCLKITREVLDIHFPKKNIKLVTNGMSTGDGWNNYRWRINQGSSIVLPDMFVTLLQGTHPQQQDKTNYLQFVDAIGLHSYPPLEDNMLEILNEYHFDPINAILNGPMPYWITEWGFPRTRFENNGGEARRLQYFRSFVQALEAIESTEMATLFDFDLNEQHRIWENGALLESGKIFQEINN